MLCTFRHNHQRCFSHYILYAQRKNFSTKVSKAVKVSNYDDPKKVGKYKNTPVRVLPLVTVKEPLCTTLPTQSVEDWTKITTDWKNLPFLYLKLSKIRLTTLVVITTVAGYAAGTAPFEICSFLCCCLGTGLVSAAANAINQYHEVPFDAQMSRTKNRVLVKAQLSPLHALGFASVASLSGLTILYSGCNGLTAALGASNLILYTCIYTPLKRMSILNTWIGSVVGAIPPIMGWSSCTGGLEPGAWLLAGILYAWQFPHFNALSWNLRPDYSRAGYRMMSVTNPGLCRRTALRYTFAITGLCLMAPLCDVTNNYFLIEMLPLNVYFTYLAFRFYQESDSASSRKLFRFSLIHLPLLIALILFNKKQWYLQNNTVNTNSSRDMQNIVSTASEKSSRQSLETAIVNVVKL